MKKIFLIAFTILLFSCKDINHYKYEKPFTIIDKNSYSVDTYSYTYQDKNGRKETFFDVKGKYSIGDTIK